MYCIYHQQVNKVERENNDGEGWCHILNAINKSKGSQLTSFFWQQTLTRESSCPCTCLITTVISSFESECQIPNNLDFKAKFSLWIIFAWGFQLILLHDEHTCLLLLGQPLQKLHPAYNPGQTLCWTFFGKSKTINNLHELPMATECCFSITCGLNTCIRDGFKICPTTFYSKAIF